MARRRRRGTKYVEDPKERAVTRCKRRIGLHHKTEGFHELTRDPVALITIDPRGKCHSVCEPSIRVLETYLRLEGNVMRKEGWCEWLDWAKKVCNFCKSKKDCDSWSRKCLAFFRLLHEKSKDLENPAVKTGADDDSGIGAGNDFKGDEINSTEKNCETTPPASVAFNEDSVDHGISLAFPANLAATGEGSGSGMVSNPLCSDIKDIELPFQTVLEQPARSDREGMRWGNSASVNAGAEVGRDPEGLNDDEMDALLFAFRKKLDNGVDCHNLSTPPVDSAIDFDEYCNNYLEDIITLPEVDGRRTLL